MNRSFQLQGAPAHLAYKTSVFVSCNKTSPTVVSKAFFSTLPMSTSEPVVSVDWLHANLQEPDVKVLDAYWYMLDEQWNPLQEYQLPHMLPSEEAFAAAVSALGIENKDWLVVYNGKGIFSAARVWWMFGVFGHHDRVWVLDGGLPRWHASGFNVESSASSDAILKAHAASEAIEKVYRGQTVGPITYQTKFQPHLVWTLEQVKKNIEDKTHQHMDAHSKASLLVNNYYSAGGVLQKMLDGSRSLLSPDELKKKI